MEPLRLDVSVTGVGEGSPEVMRDLQHEITTIARDLALPVDVEMATTSAETQEVTISIAGRHLGTSRPSKGAVGSLAHRLAGFVHAHRDALVTPAVAEHLWRSWSDRDESMPREFPALLRRLAVYRLRVDRIAAFVPRWHERDPADMFEQAFSGASRRILIEMHPDTHERMARELSGDELLPMMIDGIFYELGIHTGECEPRPAPDIDRDHVRFRINDVCTAAVPTLHADECLVNDTVARLKLLNIAGREAENPANGAACAIVPLAFKDICEQAGLTTWTPSGHVVLAASAAIRGAASAVLSEDLVALALGQLDDRFPVVTGGVNATYGPRRFAWLLRALLAEEISIRNLPSIMEVSLQVPPASEVDMNKYILFPSTWHSIRPRVLLEEDGVDQDVVEVAEYIRMSLKRYISHKYTRGANTLIVYLLDPSIEQRLSDATPLTTRESVDLLNAVFEEVGSLPPTTQNPVILTSASIRLRVRQLVRSEFPHLAALSYQELSPDMNIQPIARISHSDSRKRVR